MNKKLKPCPLCGGKVKIAQYESIAYNAKGKARIYPYIAAYCADCGVTIEEQDREELVRKWNTRTLEIVRCGECKYLRDSRNLHMGAKYKYCCIYIKEKNENDFCSLAERINEWE